VKFQLNIVDRLVLGQVLSQVSGAGNYLYHKELRILRERVSFSEKQFKEYGMVIDEATGAVRWDPKKAEGAGLEVEVGERVKNEIGKVLKELDKQERLMPEHLATYEMFVEPDKVEEPKPEEPAKA
jgi:hypothetical protein